MNRFSSADLIFYSSFDCNINKQLIIVNSSYFLSALENDTKSGKIMPHFKIIKYFFSGVNISEQY